MEKELEEKIAEINIAVVSVYVSKLPMPVCLAFLIGQDVLIIFL